MDLIKVLVSNLIFESICEIKKYGRNVLTIG